MKSVFLSVDGGRGAAASPYRGGPNRPKPGEGTAYRPTALPTVGPYALPVPVFVTGFVPGFGPYPGFVTGFILGFVPGSVPSFVPGFVPGLVDDGGGAAARGRRGVGHEGRHGVMRERHAESDMRPGGRLRGLRRKTD